jgi:Ser/Thr protein kinase RdoA (MazF antagonist)
VVVDAADPERVCGILDFGDMVRSPLVCDVAVAASYLVTQGDGPLGGAPDYVAAYHTAAPLMASEFEVLFDLVVTRLAMTVLITGWRAKLFPANAAYILRNAPSAWQGLERLAGLDRAAAREILQSACDGTAP